MNQKNIILGLLVCLSIALLTIFSLVETIPPRDLTLTRMVSVEMRIRKYWEKNGKLPTKLSDLPLEQGKDNETIDGWKRVIAYQVEGTKVILSSQGSKDKLGGEILTRSFDISVRPEGMLSDKKSSNAK